MNKSELGNLHYLCEKIRLAFKNGEVVAKLSEKVTVEKKENIYEATIKLNDGNSEKLTNHSVSDLVLHLLHFNYTKEDLGFVITSIKGYETYYLMDDMGNETLKNTVEPSSQIRQYYMNIYSDNGMTVFINEKKRRTFLCFLYYFLIDVIVLVEMAKIDNPKLKEQMQNSAIESQFDTIDKIIEFVEDSRTCTSGSDKEELDLLIKKIKALYDMYKEVECAYQEEIFDNEYQKTIEKRFICQKAKNV